MSKKKPKGCYCTAYSLCAVCFALTLNKKEPTP